MIYKIAAIFIDAYFWLRHAILILRNDATLGDNLCMTAIVSAGQKNKNRQKLWVASHRKEFFINNPHIDRFIDLQATSKLGFKILSRVAMRGGSQRVQVFDYKKNEKYSSYLMQARLTGEKKSLIDYNTQHFSKQNIAIHQSPKLYINEAERKKVTSRYNLKNGFAILHSAGKTNWTVHKEWGVHNFNELVQRTPYVNWVQVGHPSDPLLEGVIDARELSVREMAALISASDFVFCQEGLLNHIAAATNRTSIVLFTFMDSSLAEYDTTIPVHVHKDLHCAPCWNARRCQHQSVLCSEDITVELVKRQIDCIDKH